MNFISTHPPKTNRRDILARVSAALSLIPTSRRLDLLADLAMSVGNSRQAEALAHAAADLREVLR